MRARAQAATEAWERSAPRATQGPELPLQPELQPLAELLPPAQIEPGSALAAAPLLSSMNAMPKKEMHRAGKAGNRQQAHEARTTYDFALQIWGRADRSTMPRIHRIPDFASAGDVRDASKITYSRTFYTTVALQANLSASNMAGGCGGTLELPPSISAPDGTPRRGHYL